MTTAFAPPTRFSTRGAFAGVAAGVLILVAGGFFEAFVADEDAALHELADATALHRLLDETLRLTLDGETAQRGYVLTADPLFLGPLTQSRVLLPDRLDALGGLLRVKHEDAAAEELRAQVESRSEWTEETVALAESGDLEGARTRIATGEGLRRTDRIRALTAEIGAREDEHVGLLLARVERSRQRVHVAFAVILAIALVLLVLLGAGLQRDLWRLATMAEHAEENERRFRSLAESASDLVRIHTPDGRMEYVSPSSQRLVGYSPEELVAMPPFALLPAEDAIRFRTLLDRMFLTESSGEMIRHGIVRRDGALRIYDTRIDLAHDQHGRMTRYHTIGQDVTERVQEEARLTEKATKDPLTSLLNAGALTEQGLALLSRCEAEHKHALLAFCDVNGLKVINDELGHEAGDSAIIDAANLLRSSARDSDLVARVGGDEFVLLGIVGSEQAAQTFSERLEDRIRAFNDGGGRAYRVSLSVGTAVFLPSNGTTLEMLRAEADAAMYKHKKSRRGQPFTDSGELLIRGSGPKPN